MGIFDFMKEAGERIFGGDDKKDEQETPARDLDTVLADKNKGTALTQMVGRTGLAIEDLRVKFRDGLATVSGRASSQADREKAILLVGNTQGVAQVDDRIEVLKKEPEARMHTVVSGDTLSKIAKKYYGDAMKYPTIFEANKPMLQDPNKIYPGQVLRIPQPD